MDEQFVAKYQGGAWRVYDVLNEEYGTAEHPTAAQAQASADRLNVLFY